MAKVEYADNMNTSAIIAVRLPREEKKRLGRLALRYGLSLPEFSRRVLTELAAEIPEESLKDYENPRKLSASYQRALRDWKTGRVRTRI